MTEEGIQNKGAAYSITLQIEEKIYIQLAICDRHTNTYAGNLKTISYTFKEWYENIWAAWQS